MHFPVATKCWGLCSFDEFLLLFVDFFEVARDGVAGDDAEEGETEDPGVFEALGFGVLI